MAEKLINQRLAQASAYEEKEARREPLFKNATNKANSFYCYRLGKWFASVMAAPWYAPVRHFPM
jgi:hypothetical protein